MTDSTGYTGATAQVIDATINPGLTPEERYDKKLRDQQRAAQQAHSAKQEHLSLRYAAWVVCFKRELASQMNWTAAMTTDFFKLTASLEHFCLDRFELRLAPQDAALELQAILEADAFVLGA